METIQSETGFSGRDIIVIGFSGTDLDFDLDYIPIAQAIQGGSKVTWVIRPGTVLNHNVKILMEQYPGSVNLYTGELSSLFEALGVDYKKINNNLGIALGEDTEALIEKKIRELFTSEHIGPHGCIGYCISLLEMMGASDEASKIAAIYEKKIDLSDVNIFSVLGLNALARRKMHEAKFEESKQYYQAVLDCFQYMNKLAEEITGSENKMVNQDLEAAAKKERQVNTAMIYNNLGLISFYRNEFNEAEKLFTNAKEIIESTNSNKHLDVISFNIARTNYKRDKDYDKYLLLLKQSAMYAKKTGNLHTLVEILVEECKIRLEIGEYYLAQHSLNEIEDHTKNIGDFRTHINAGILKAQYFLRTGERNKSLQCLQKLIIFIENRNDQFCAMHLLSKIAEMYSYNNEIAEQIDRLCDISNTDAGKIKEAWKQQIDKTEEAECFLPYFIVETLPNDDDRKVIIQLEYKKEKRWLSKFF